MPSKRALVSNDASPGILMLLSPAKTLDLSSCNQRLHGSWTIPECDEAKTRQVAAVLKDRTPKELESLLNISKNLAKNAHEVRRRIL